MVRLIRFEYRKHFFKPSIIIAILVFSLISAFKIYGIYSENSMFSRGHSAEESAQIKQLYWDYYKEFGGEITTDKIEQLLEIYRPIEAKTADLTASTRMDDPNTYTGNVYTDYHFFRRCFVLPMEHDYMYQSYAQQVVTAAQENMSFYQAVGNTYDYRKNAAIAESFSGRQIQGFAFTEMYQYYLHYDFSSFLALLLCVYGLVGVFVSEKESEMDTLLLTTKHGGSKTIVGKLVSSALFVIGVCTWFWLFDFAVFSTVFGSVEGAAAPLYAIKSFADTSLNLTLGQYALLSGVFKTMGMLALGVGILLLSSLFKNSLLPFALSLAGAFGLIYWQGAFMGSGYLWVKVTNPFVLMVNRELFRKTEFVNLFGFPIPSYIMAMLMAILWGVAFSVILVVTVRKSAVVGKAVRQNAV
ncbi:ABC transporter permease [Oscillibacter sp.]|uniref:ABC transporter permease n=1 Tax=Oscillibacter sp. TaxID=1945593 RepID=UPI002897B951|nr:ABC transporter permease [Oscillibacter sp.]